MPPILLATVFLCPLVTGAAAGSVPLSQPCSPANGSQADCADVNAICPKQGAKCTCSSGYTDSGTICIVNGAIGGACLRDSKCTNVTSVCESKLCKAKAGENCSFTTDCVSQSTCSGGVCRCNSGTTAASYGLCKTNGTVGGACLPGSTCIDPTSVCDASRCKIRAGEFCTYTRNCVSQSSCVSEECVCYGGMTPTVDGLCFADGTLGGACLLGSTCTAPSLICESTECKTKAGENCSFTKECVSQSTCSGGICTCNAGFTAAVSGLCKANGTVGGSCLAGSLCISPTSLCDSFVCKAKAGQPCSFTSECVSLSTCVLGVCTCYGGFSPAMTGLCVADGILGGACLLGSTCSAVNLVCDSTVCKIRAGQPCSSVTHCVSQSTCVGYNCTCNKGYTATLTGLCNEGAHQPDYSWLLTGSILSLLMTLYLL